MKVVVLNPVPQRVSISTYRENTTKQIFDTANFQKVDPKAIEDTYVDLYKKHIKTLTTLIVSRIALTAAMTDVERHLAEVMTNGSSTAPVQLATPENTDMFDAVYTKALREYAINASAEIAVSDEALRKDYINNFSIKSPAKVAAPGNPIGIRKTAADIERETNSAVNRLADAVNKHVAPADQVDSPYGDTAPIADGRLPMANRTPIVTRVKNRHK